MGARGRHATLATVLNANVCPPCIAPAAGVTSFSGMSSLSGGSSSNLLTPMGPGASKSLSKTRLFVVVHKVMQGSVPGAEAGSLIQVFYACGCWS